MGQAVLRYHEMATKERRTSGQEDDEGSRIGAIGDTMYMTLEALMMLFLRELRPSASDSDASVLRVFGLKLAECVVRLGTSLSSIRATARDVAESFGRKDPQRQPTES